MENKRFNIRVYGILINERNELLVSDELIRGLRFTKFPGGGLEWGEGIRECLVREFMEELNQPVEVLDHFYSTDYFQVSAFNPDDQLVSIYFKVRLKGDQQFKTGSRPFDFPDSNVQQCEVPRWINIQDISPEDFKWPVDKVVAEMLTKQ